MRWRDVWGCAVLVYGKLMWIKASDRSVVPKLFTVLYPFRHLISSYVLFCQWFCFLMNACSSLRSLLCLLERNTALQDKILGNLADFDAQNNVSVWKLQFCFKGYIPRIQSVFRYRGNVLPAYPLNHFAYPWGYTYPSLGTEAIDELTKMTEYCISTAVPGEKTHTGQLW